MKKIVVGLGNPGSRYERTRHNIGWMVLDRLAERIGSVGHVRARDGAATVRGRSGDIELILVKPTTYMNLSGQAVRRVLARERVPMRDVLIVVDDMALPFGRLRLRERGSDGGHNGLRSIIGEMGTQEFARLRVGIGAPRRGAVEHVLGDFAHAEQAHLEVILGATADAVEDWAHRGAAVAANRWNAWRPELEAPAGPARERAGEPADSPTGASTAAPAEGRGGPGEPGPSGAATPAAQPAGAAPAERLGGAGAEGSPSAPRAEPDDDGIVRTRSGWRKLLPGWRRDEGREQSRR